MWIDKGKTILLNLLVLTSLVLTWLLVNSQPDYDYLHPAQYIEPQPIGETKELHEVVKPQAIILHYGNGKYTGTSADSIYHRVIQKEMEKWYFFNMTRVNFTKQRLNQVYQQKKAIEIIYSAALPMDILEELFTFRGKVDTMIDSVGRILIYVDDTEKETYALLIDKEGKEMIQARTAVTPKDLDQFYLSLGNSFQEMMVVDSNGESVQPPFYLPKGPINMKQYRYFYQPIPVFQMIQTLFVDPSLTRQVIERDGTAIYTDGSKSVQIPPNRYSIHYYDPMTEPVNDSAEEGSFHSVIQFVNQHGGWNGTFLLEGVEIFPAQKEKMYQFRQHVASYPLYGSKEESLGLINVVSRQSFILEYHRSLFNLDTFFDYEDVPIMTGQELLNRLTALGFDIGEITDITLGYTAEMNDHHLTLTPKWIIKKGDDRPIMLDARRRAGKEEPDGLEKSQNDIDYRLPASG